MKNVQTLLRLFVQHFLPIMVFIFWIWFVINIPLENVQILDVLTYLGSCLQRNSKTVEWFFSCLENKFNWIGKIGYNKMSDLQIAYVVPTTNINLINIHKKNWRMIISLSNHMHLLTNFTSWWQRLLQATMFTRMARFLNWSIINLVMAILLEVLIIHFSRILILVWILYLLHKKMLMLSCHKQIVLYVV